MKRKSIYGDKANFEFSIETRSYLATAILKKRHIITFCVVAQFDYMDSTPFIFITIMTLLFCKEIELRCPNYNKAI